MRKRIKLSKAMSALTSDEMRIVADKLFKLGMWDRTQNTREHLEKCWTFINTMLYKGCDTFRPTQINRIDYWIDVYLNYLLEKNDS